MLHRIVVGLIRCRRNERKHVAEALRPCALNHAQNRGWSRWRFTEGNGCHRPEQINGPLEFDQGPQRADVCRRPSMTLVSNSQQFAPLARLGFPQFMSQSLVECRREQLALDERGAVSTALGYG